jgi:hypothetical protein
VSVPPDLGVLVVGMLPWRAGEPEMLQDDHEDLIGIPVYWPKTFCTRR